MGVLKEIKKLKEKRSEKDKEYWASLHRIKDTVVVHVRGNYKA